MDSEAMWRSVAAGLRVVWWASLLSIPADLLALLATFQAASGVRDESHELLKLACALGALPWLLYLTGQWWCFAAWETRAGDSIGWSFGVAVAGTFAFGAASAAGLFDWAYAAWALAAAVSGAFWLAFLFQLTQQLQAHAAHARLTAYRKRLVGCVVAAIGLSWGEWVSVRRTNDNAVGLILAVASVYSLYISWYYFAALRAAASAVELQSKAAREGSSGSP